MELYGAPHAFHGKRCLVDTRGLSPLSTTEEWITAFATEFLTRRGLPSHLCIAGRPGGALSNLYASYN